MFTCFYKKLSIFINIITGDEDIVTILIEYGYSPFLSSFKGRNAVHAAAYHGHINLLKLFFEGEVTKKMINNSGGVKKCVNIMTK